MQKRQFGRTGLQVSLLTFGCGAVGGLMTKGDPRDQERAVARAVELGINHFDTAPLYGNGASEENLGRILASLKPNVIVSTKVRIAPADRQRIGAAIAASIETSLKRLRRDSVDLFQLHNPLAHAGRRREADAGGGAGRGGAGLRAPAHGGQGALPRLHRDWRYAGAAAADRLCAPSMARRCPTMR